MSSKKENPDKKTVLNPWERIALLNRLGTSKVLEGAVKKPSDIDNTILVHVLLTSQQHGLPTIIINVPVSDVKVGDFEKVINVLTNGLKPLIQIETDGREKARVCVPICFDGYTESQLFAQAKKYANLATYWFDKNSQIVVGKSPTEF